MREMFFVTREEIAQNFAQKIEIERTRLGYTQAKMAKALQVSLSTYKNIINGVSRNISLYTVYKVYKLTGSYYSDLCGDESPELDFLVNFRKLPDCKKKAISTFANLELMLAEDEQSLSEKEDYMVVYVPTGNMEDGMYYDSSSQMKIPIGRYQRICHHRIDCGIKITNNSFHPVYHQDDILLIHQEPPRDGDTGVFINRDTKRMYIRRFRQTDCWQLEPLTSSGPVIRINNRNNEILKTWIIFGYVLMKMR